MRWTYAQVHFNLIPRLKSLTRNASNSFVGRGRLGGREGGAGDSVATGFDASFAVQATHVKTYKHNVN